MLLQHQAAADSITTCAGLGTLYGDVGGKIPKLVNAEKTPYHTAILAAETKYPAPGTVRYFCGKWIRRSPSWKAAREGAGGRRRGHSDGQRGYPDSGA